MIKDVQLWPLWLKGAVTLFITLVLLGVIYWCDTALQLQALAEEYAIENELLLIQQQQTKARSDPTVAVAAQRAQALNQLLAQWPKPNEMPTLLEAITQQATQAGLVVCSLRLLPENRLPLYTECPIELIVEGHYHRMGMFMSAISAMSFMITCHDFSVYRAESVDHSEKLRLNLSLKTYQAHNVKVIKHLDSAPSISTATPYTASMLRSPFGPWTLSSKVTKRSVTEQTPSDDLDTMKRVGTLKNKQSQWILMQDKTGKIHHVIQKDDA